MTKENRATWNKLKKARRLTEQANELLDDAMTDFLPDELVTVNLHASNSNNLEETVQCFVLYGEDEKKVQRYLQKRDINKI